MKKPTTLIILLAALVAFAWYYNQNKSRKFSGITGGVRTREFLLPDFPVNEVRSIRIHEADKTVNIVWRDGKWQVAERDGYPAAFEKVQRALMSMRELKISGKHVLPQKSLAEIRVLAPEATASERTGLQVELLNEKGGTLANFIVGLNVNSTGGATADSFLGGAAEQRFVRLLSDDNVAKDQYTVWQVGEGLYEFQPDAQEWIDKAFVDVRKIQSVAVTAPNPADSWTVQRADENGEFKFAESTDGAELDAAKAAGLSYLLSNPTFNDVLTKDKITPELMKGATKTKLTTFEGFRYEVEAVEKKDPKARPEAPGKCLLTFNVSADIAKARKAEPNEKEEEKKKKDEEFAANVIQLEEKLAKEKSAEGRVYELSSDALAILFKKRSELIHDKNAPPAAAQPGAPSTFNLPGLSRPAQSTRALPTAPAGAPEVKAPVPVSPPGDKAKSDGQ